MQEIDCFILRHKLDVICQVLVQLDYLSFTWKKRLISSKKESRSPYFKLLVDFLQENILYQLNQLKESEVNPTLKIKIVTACDCIS